MEWIAAKGLTDHELTMVYPAHDTKGKAAATDTLLMKRREKESSTNAFVLFLFVFGLVGLLYEEYAPRTPSLKHLCLVCQDG